MDVVSLEISDIPWDKEDREIQGTLRVFFNLSSEERIKFKRVCRAQTGEIVFRYSDSSPSHHVYVAVTKAQALRWFKTADRQKVVGCLKDMLGQILNG